MLQASAVFVLSYATGGILPVVFLCVRNVDPIFIKSLSRMTIESIKKNHREADKNDDVGMRCG